MIYGLTRLKGAEAGESSPTPPNMSYTFQVVGDASSAKTLAVVPKKP